MNVYFYLSRTKDEPQLPQSISEFTTADRFDKPGEYCWIMQTYLWLKEFGFPCKLVREIPDQGIIIAHRVGLSYSFRPNPKQFFVSIKADYNPHPFAHVNIVQNPKEVNLPSIAIQSKKYNRYLLPGYKFFIPFWPQQDLIPRHPDQGNAFEKIAYFGISANLDPALRDKFWAEKLSDMGLQWITFRARDEWNDYSKIDAIVAVREFNASTDYSWKPASKLYNSWRAGVPALLGPEAAYQAERKSELDYIEVNSIDELLFSLNKLKENPQMRKRIAKNHRIRAQEITPEKITQRWQSFIQEVCRPLYKEWIRKTPLQRSLFYTHRKSSITVCSLKKRVSAAE